jgi:O-antigen ligase
MLPALKRSDARSRWNFFLLMLFLAIVLLLGGASRSDVLTQPLVRLAAIALIAVSVVQMRANEWRQIRTPAIFLLAIAGIIAIQLVPLPPSLWAQLPGRALYAEALQSAGTEPVWRPLSLVPDLTLNALLSILPPLAVVLALGIIDRSLHRLLAPAIIIGLIISCSVGVLQIAGDGFYFYNITNGGSAVGVFANRNHQALFISAAFPVLAAWAELPHEDPSYQRLRTWLARCISAALFPILLITGSRAGLALGILGAILAIAMVEIRRGSHKRSTPLLSLLLLRAVPLALGMFAVGITIFLAKGEALHRLMGAEQADTRIVLLPVFAKMAGSYFPWGSGYGSFDSVFRAYEPDWFLSPNYLNQAHNDLAQILIEGGIFPMILLAAFLAWFLVQSWKLWTRRTLRPEQLLGRAGSAAAILILLASLVDYPLRTPLIAVLMAAMCMWMLSADNVAPERQDEGDRLGSREGVG